ncbi:hypothetical protein Tco_0017834 [Tanacetum coccineum]
MIIPILHGIQILGIASTDVRTLSEPKPSIFVIVCIKVAEQTNIRFNIANAAQNFKMRNLADPTRILENGNAGKWVRRHEEGRKWDTVVGIIEESGVHSNFTSWSFMIGSIRAWQLRMNFLGNKIFAQMPSGVLVYEHI